MKTKCKQNANKQPPTLELGRTKPSGADNKTNKSTALQELQARRRQNKKQQEQQLVQKPTGAETQKPNLKYTRNINIKQAGRQAGRQATEISCQKNWN